ncbi:MAG: hypothetical protein HYY25_02430 [Candidatus Wallbacteria bacterium]|nr:hypothetical protein [Candidatus Wallbacteria bacterium]
MLCLALGLAGAPAGLAGSADPEPFFKRLESIGLDTTTIRKLSKKLTIVFRDPDDDKEAEYGYIRKRLYLPTEIREPGTDRIKFDIPSYNLNTLLHEYTHAYDYLMASEKAPAKSNERLFWDGWNSIRADIHLNPKEQILGGLARYPGMKASEVCGYFIGDCYMNIFDAVQSIVVRNEAMTDYIRTQEDVDSLGGTLVLPSKNAEQGWSRNLANLVFGKANMTTAAMFNGKTVNWDENRDWVKKQLFASALGLNPPKDVDELVERLNKLDNEWIRGIRVRVIAARKKALAKRQAAAASEPGLDDLRNR